jgi:hypothetical protein
MAGVKKLINRTGNDLKVTLTVREGDTPSQTAGTVEVELAAGRDKATGLDTSRQVVAYGDDTNIYLNGIETQMIVKGSAVGERRIVVTRGSGLDNALNTNDTIEFLYDGKSILISATNSGDKPFRYAAEAGEDQK